MARIRLRNCYVRFLDGFRATAKVGVNATPETADATLDIDTFAPGTPATAVTIPLGVRFTIAGVSQIYTVTSVTLNDASGAVNDTPADGNTDLDVDGITGRIPVGTTFTVVGSSLTFTVTDTTETDGNTTNIEFTPAIATATGVPSSDAVITFEQKPTVIGFTPPLATAAHIPSAEDVITIVGRALNIKVGDGNITWNESVPTDYQLDRGTLDAVVQGDDAPVDVTLNCSYEFLTAVTASGVPTPEDVLENRGEASTWITSGADPCEPYAIDIEIDHVPPCTGVEHEITPFPEFRVEKISHDVAGATLAISGKCKTTSITQIRRAY